MTRMTRFEPSVTDIVTDIEPVTDIFRNPLPVCARMRAYENFSRKYPSHPSLEPKKPSHIRHISVTGPQYPSRLLPALEVAR